MAKKPQNPSRRQSAAPENNADALRSAAGVTGGGKTPRDLLPIPILMGIFAVVWVFIIWLMAPEFRQNWNNYMYQRYQRQGQWDKAIPHLEWLHARREKTKFMHYGYPYHLGLCHLEMGRHDEAIKWFTMAQERRNSDRPDDQGRKPAAPDYNTKLGLAYFRKGDTAKAREHLDLALAHNRLDPEAHFTYGELEINEGRFREAVEHFKVVADNKTYEAKVKEYYARVNEEMFDEVEEEEAGATASADGETTGAEAAGSAS